MEMLFLKRTQAIILDINIFKYYMKHKAKSYYTKPFSVHYIFNERPYSFGLKSKEMLVEFDKNIQLMKENGSYQLILDNYLNE